MSARERFPRERFPPSFSARKKGFSALSKFLRLSLSLSLRWRLFSRRPQGELEAAGEHTSTRTILKGLKRGSGGEGRRKQKKGSGRWKLFFF